MNRINNKITLGRVGKWSLENVTIAPGEVVEFFYKESSFFPGDYTWLKHDVHGVVRINSVSDFFNMQDCLRRAKGSVLLNGVGMGNFLTGVLDNPAVTLIMVVEKDKDLFKLVCEDAKKREPTDRLQIFNADPVEWWPPQVDKWTREQWSVVWNEMWHLKNGDVASEINRMKRKYARRCDFVGAWREKFFLS